jgi:hypothetical protein
MINTSRLRYLSFVMFCIREALRAATVIGLAYCAGCLGALEERRNAGCTGNEEYPAYARAGRHHGDMWTCL